jgi:hypothetical protein
MDHWHGQGTTLCLELFTIIELATYTVPSWRNNLRSDCSVVKWGGIQTVLEECQSDVLLLLDCCYSGTSNTNEGNGITELISACDYRTIANGVGSYSFTHALVTELLESAKMPHFSVLELYNNIYFRIQGHIPEDGRKRHPAPVHLVLTNSDRYWQSIILSKQPATSQSRHLILDQRDRVTADTSYNSTSVNDVPCLALAISLANDITKEAFSTRLFADWLRNMPILPQRVRIEAGFGNFQPQLLRSSRSLFLPPQASSSGFPESISTPTPQSPKSILAPKIVGRYPMAIAADRSIFSSWPAAMMESSSVALASAQSLQTWNARLRHPCYTLELVSYTLKFLSITKTNREDFYLSLIESQYWRRYTAKIKDRIVPSIMEVMIIMIIIVLLGPLCFS